MAVTRALWATAPTFLIAGQSNMAGRCLEVDLLGEFTFSGKPSPSFGGVEFEMCWDNDSNFGAGGGNSNGQWLPLQCQQSPGLGGLRYFGPEFGIASTLGPRLFDMGFRKARFLKFALGSTNIHSNWNPDNGRQTGKPGEVGHYTRFRDFALRHSGDHGVVGLFWLQGESDSSKAKDANAYLDNFDRFATALRRDLSCPEIVVSPVVWNGKRVDTINQALKETEDRVKHCVCIDTLDQSFGIQSVDAWPGRAGHLDAEAVCDVGKRMGRAMPLDNLRSTLTGMNPCL